MCRVSVTATASLISTWCVPVIPWERYVWERPVNAPELLGRVAALTVPVGRFDLFPKETTRQFRGRVGGAGFKIGPVIRYRNSMVPVIVGRLTPTPQGTRVVVTLRLAWPVVGLLVLWFALVGRFFAAMWTQAGAGEVSPLQILIPVGMGLFVGVLTVVCFKQESRLARGKLQELFGS